ncbi:MAG: hypothetical protein XD78_1417 [Desulfotomaculum sp. 46_296]|nr:MAG: hypothetical protein XD78_1417 [Desulfotomaculum sp. 46_296]
MIKIKKAVIFISFFSILIYPRLEVGYLLHKNKGGKNFYKRMRPKYPHFQAGYL